LFKNKYTAMDSSIELKEKIKREGILKKSICQDTYYKEYSDIIKIDSISGTWAEKLWIYVYGKSYCICQKETKWMGFKKGGYQKYCSRKCATRDPILIKSQNESRKKTSLKKYGVTSPTKMSSVKRKAEETNMKKYGAKSPMQNKDILHKSRETLRSNYGVESPSHHPEILKKRIESFKKSTFKENYKKTSIDKYGTSHPWSNSIVHNKTTEFNKKNKDKINEKRKATINEKYGVDFITQSQDIQNKIKNTFNENYAEGNPSKNAIIKKKISTNLKSSLSKKLLNNNNDILEISEDDLLTCKCDKNHVYEIERGLYNQRKKLKITRCTICKPYKQGSELQKIISSFLEDPKNNDRKLIYPYEIDILIEDKLAIEVNGMYWHSDRNKEKNYHQKKAKNIHSKNIPFLTIWEDDWNSKEEILKSMISNFIGKSKKIYARECEIKEISGKESKDFLNKNHLQGHINSSIKIGLFYKNELVSLMTFGGLRKSLGTTAKENQWELLRFCNKLNLSVTGGAGKLLKYFERNYNPEKIISYAAYERSNGNLYKNLGFKFNHLTSPGYFYYKNGARFNRFRFRKSELIKEGYNPSKTGFEIMNELGYLRCYDAGNLKFTKTY